MKLLREYCKYFDYRADEWEKWNMDNDESKYELNLDMICVMQDAGMRLVAYFDNPTSSKIRRPPWKGGEGNIRHSTMGIFIGLVPGGMVCFGQARGNKQVLKTNNRPDAF